MMARIPKTWLIADTHFNHRAMVDRSWRPADFERRIELAWIRLVQSQDLVYHLGDVILGNKPPLHAILSALPGTKILVRGNHDHESDGWYHRAGFAFVATGILTRGCWLTHAPESQLPSGAIVNIHGHLHGDEHRGAASALPAFCRLLALEDPAVDYAPQELEKFVRISQLLDSPKEKEVKEALA